MARRPTIRMPAPKPDKTLYADFLAAVTQVVKTGNAITVHGYRIDYPKRAGSYGLAIDAPRTMRDPWTGALSYAIGRCGGDALRPKSVATRLTFDLMSDRAHRAQLLADAAPGILAGSFTHEPEAA